MLSFFFTDGTTTTEAPTTTTMNPDADCRNFTLNRCNFGNDTLITSVFQEDDEYCNFLCQVTYGDKQLLADKCSYFIYDYTNQQCDGTLHYNSKSCERSHYLKAKIFLQCTGQPGKTFQHSVMKRVALFHLWLTIAEENIIAM